MKRRRVAIRLALAHTTWTCMDLANWIVDAAATVAVRPASCSVTSRT